MQTGDSTVTCVYRPAFGTDCLGVGTGRPGRSALDCEHHLLCIKRSANQALPYKKCDHLRYMSTYVSSLTELQLDLGR